MKNKILIIVIVLIVLGIGGFFIAEKLGQPSKNDGPPREIKSEIREPADLTQITSFYHASDPDWSPNGSRLVFEGQAEEGKETGIYLINIDGTGLTKISSEHNPSWSPIDNRILLREDREQGNNLILIDLDKGWEKEAGKSR